MWCRKGSDTRSASSDTASGMLQERNALPPTNDPRHWFGKSLAAPQRLRGGTWSWTNAFARAGPPCSLLFSPPIRVAAVQHTQLLDLSCSLLREWSVPALLSFVARQQRAGANGTLRVLLPTVLLDRVCFCGAQELDPSLHLVYVPTQAFPCCRGSGGGGHSFTETNELVPVRGSVLRWTTRDGEVR